MSAAPATTSAGRARNGVAWNAALATGERALIRASSALQLRAPAPRPSSTTAAPARRERTRPDLRALPTPTRLHRGLRAAILLVGMAVIVLGVLGVVTLNALAAEASFEARTLERDIAQMTLHHDDLVAEVAALAGPARVREVATTRLGMMAPETPGFLTLDPADVPAPPRKPLRPLSPTTPTWR